jgi:CBS domain-containing protein
LPVNIEYPLMHINLNARDVMQIRVHSVPPEMPLSELEREFSDHQVSGFPVVENGQLVGVVSRADVVRQLQVERRLAETTSEFYWDRTGFHEEPTESIQEIAGRVGRRLEDLRVKDVMSEHLVVLCADDAVEIVAQKFLEHHIHRAPVVDQGRLVGIISTLDLARLFAEHRVKTV